ncbi:hypothetical protein [Halostagnicola sp. A-GB9-2]|nr:hypothetical protein [Halostagnicola sp. A-GB9-2]MDJ1434741.1 hypothetical protein [Halostagnicola sp. A-GB9-2]
MKPKMELSASLTLLNQLKCGDTEFDFGVVLAKGLENFGFIFL